MGSLSFRFPAPYATHPAAASHSHSPGCPALHRIPESESAFHRNIVLSAPRSSQSAFPFHKHFPDKGICTLHIFYSAPRRFFCPSVVPRLSIKHWYLFCEQHFCKVFLSPFRYCFNILVYIKQETNILLHFVKSSEPSNNSLHIINNVKLNFLTIKRVYKIIIRIRGMICDWHFEQQE